MKIYVAGYTREGVLRTFSNLPREHKAIVAELQMEKLSEGIQEGFLWRIHSNKMYSCTLVSSLWDKKIDERNIPLIISYVMDKAAAEFIMESPLRLIKLTEQLKAMEREDVLGFSNAHVLETWGDALESDADWNVVVDAKKVEGIVQAVVKMTVEEDAEFAGFVYEAKAELFAALEVLPMALRMNFSFSFPFSGCGAGVCDINMTDSETMKQGREKSYSGWPLVQRLVLPAELNLSERAMRVSHEIQRIYHTYGKMPLKNQTVEALVRRLELLSYMNEYNKEPTKALKKIILKNKNKRMKIEELLRVIDGIPSKELEDLVRRHSKKGTINIEDVMLVMMCIVVVASFLAIPSEIQITTDSVHMVLKIMFFVRYIFVFLLGLFAGIVLSRRKSTRKEKR